MVVLPYCNEDDGSLNFLLMASALIAASSGDVQRDSREKNRNVRHSLCKQQNSTGRERDPGESSQLRHGT